MKTLKSLSVYWVFWLILTEKFTLESMLVGLLISFLLYKVQSEVFTEGGITVKQVLLGMKFVVLLIAEIIKANIVVAMIILSPSIDVAPEIVKKETTLRSPLLRTILANAITLTPGTMTVDLKGDTLMIHCLNNEYAKSVEFIELEQILVEMEG